MTDATLVLRELTADDAEAFLDGLRAWDGDDPSWHSFVWRDGLDYAEMLAILDRERRGVDLAPGRVQHTMLYAFVDGRIVGRCSVRHALSDTLRRRGGHVGYAVAPPYRGRGHAGEILRQGLAHCASLGIPSIMLTCDDANVASWRTIERAGGRLAEIEWQAETAGHIRRYWIDLPART